MARVLALIALGLAGCATAGDKHYEEFVAKIEADKQAEARAKECAPPWHRYRLPFQEAKDARHADKPFVSGQGVPSAPSDLYKRFAGFADELPAVEAKGCEIAQRTEFDVEWAYLQEREQARLDALDALRNASAATVQQAAAARATVEADHQAEAKRRGFKGVVTGQSLTVALNEVVASAMDVTKLKGIAIELGRDDDGFVAEQVLAGGVARFTSEYCDAQFVLRGYKGAVYEGTSLAALNITAVQLVGVKSYPTAIGGTAQAFVVEPAW
jgi:hypothetical protein